MLICKSTDVIRVITGSSGAIDSLVNFANYDPAAAAEDRVTVDRQKTAITIATTTTILTGPSGSVVRNAVEISISNKHASTANLLTVQHFDGTTVSQLFDYNLLAGEEMQYADGRWIVIDATGAIKYSNIASLASQADMESGTSTTVAVVPGRQHFHPGHPKCWVSCGVAADIQQSYNVTSLTDTGTGIVTVTIATDFAGTNYMAQVSVEKTNTTFAMADGRIANIRSATRAAGSVGFNCHDTTTTTNLVKDPTTWHIVMFGDQP